MPLSSFAGSGLRVGFSSFVGVGLGMSVGSLVGSFVGVGLRVGICSFVGVGLRMGCRVGFSSCGSCGCCGFGVGLSCCGCRGCRGLRMSSITFLGIGLLESCSSPVVLVSFISLSGVWVRGPELGLACGLNVPPPLHVSEPL